MAQSDAFRVRFPEDESREPWLGLLLDAYAVLDAGLAAALAADGRTPACRSGCAACCRQPIPASSLEMLGLTWYAYRHVRGDRRRELRRSLRWSMPGRDCPFLVEDTCVAYPVRPMACREFVMLGRPCREGEQPASTRPGDMLPLPVAVQRQAFRIMLPYYGLTDPNVCEEALRQRLILRDTDILQGHDWAWLVKVVI